MAPARSTRAEPDSPPPGAGWLLLSAGGGWLVAVLLGYALAYAVTACLSIYLPLPRPDRVSFGRVTDFIVWKVSAGGRVYEWPTFNIADAALVIGVALLLIDWPRDAVIKEQPPKQGA